MTAILKSFCTMTKISYNGPCLWDGRGKEDNLCLSIYTII